MHVARPTPRAHHRRFLCAALRPAPDESNVREEKHARDSDRESRRDKPAPPIPAQQPRCRARGSAMRITRATASRTCSARPRSPRLHLSQRLRHPRANASRTGCRRWGCRERHRARLPPCGMRRSSCSCVSAARDSILLGSRGHHPRARRTSSRTRRSSAWATGDSFAKPCALKFHLLISTARRVHQVRIHYRPGAPVPQRAGLVKATEHQVFRW
jgi:hypothetical protein